MPIQFDSAVFNPLFSPCPLSMPAFIWANKNENVVCSFWMSMTTTILNTTRYLPSLFHWLVATSLAQLAAPCLSLGAKCSAYQHAPFISLQLYYPFSVLIHLYLYSPFCRMISPVSINHILTYLFLNPKSLVLYFIQAPTSMS
jgi:hypothetical protein